MNLENTSAIAPDKNVVIGTFPRRFVFPEIPGSGALTDRSAGTLRTDGKGERLNEKSFRDGLTPFPRKHDGAAAPYPSAAALLFK